jgi:ABC-2 type transport system ATP-binding protein
MGLVGINGAGKTTLLRLISGVYVADEGEILCDGTSIINEEARKNIFFLPDDPYYTLHTTGKSLFDMYKVFYPDIDRPTFEKYMSEFGLDEKKPIRNFSKGMRRQLYIALSLACSPKHLLLDEAFDGLDPLSRLSFKKHLNALVEEKGTSVIISSHSLRELEDFCDKFAMIDNRTVISSGDITEKVSSLCKFELAFNIAPDKSVFEHLDPLMIEQNGRFVRIVVKGDAEKVRSALEELSPLIIEELPMDFEEAFISEASRRGYII